MFRSVLLCSCFTLAVAASACFGQRATPVADPLRPSTVLESLAGDLAVAHVYVSNTQANGTDNQITEYSATINGRLIPVSGSPYMADDTDIVVVKNNLYGINRTAPSIDGFSIGLDGGLTYLTSTDYAQFNPSDCGYANWIFPDRTSANLYATEFLGDCANNTFESFVAQSGGGLTNLGQTNGGAGSFGGVNLPLAFLGNNLFGYEATNDSCMYFQVWSFQRQASGLLGSSTATTTMPAAPEGFRTYIPTYLATDPTNHAAIALWPANPPGCSTAPIQIGAFTADGSGNLTTTNTSANMPATTLTSVNDMKISPAGDLLAVGGTGGLQVFHFNGAAPVTAFTNALTTDTIGEMFWDRFGHLYALSQSAGRLHVFNVTAGSATEAPGSPYPVNQPIHLAVQVR